MATKRTSSKVTKTAKKAATSANASVTGQNGTRGPVVAATLLSIVSIAFGVLIHHKGIWWNPLSDMDLLTTRSIANVKRDLSLSKSWPGTTVFEDYIPHAWRFLLVLVVAFQDIFESQQGQALILILTSVSAPLITFMSTEAIKDGRNRLLGAALLIFVTSLGQAIMLGAAIPIAFVPVYAFTRVIENASTVHPLPSPSKLKLGFLTILNSASIGTIFLTAFTPLHTEQFVWNNFAFQFYPLVWIPLFFFSYKKAVASTPGSAAARQEPRLDAASNYQILSYVTIPLYYFGLWWGGKTLFDQVFLQQLGLKSAGPLLLVWDAIGVLGATALVVLIDSYVDESKVQQGGVRTHARRTILEDVIVGLPGLILLGPGWAASRYFQRREILAEKVRFGK